MARGRAEAEDEVVAFSEESESAKGEESRTGTVAPSSSDCRPALESLNSGKLEYDGFRACDVSWEGKRLAEGSWSASVEIVDEGDICCIIAGRPIASNTVVFPEILAMEAKSRKYCARGEVVAPSSPRPQIRSLGVCGINDSAGAMSGRVKR